MLQVQITVRHTTHCELHDTSQWSAHGTDYLLEGYARGFPLHASDFKTTVMLHPNGSLVVTGAGIVELYNQDRILVSTSTGATSQALYESGLQWLL